MNISSNLYPIQTNYGLGLIGFTTFEEAQQYATKHSMELVGFTKKRNAKFWEEGDEAYGPYDLLYFYTNRELYSRFFSVSEFWAYVQKTLNEMGEDENFTLTQIDEWLCAQKRIKSQMSKMSEEEFAIVWSGTNTCEILPRVAMSWHDYINDTSYEVGCFQPYNFQD
jgi:hypothetical protein